MVSSVELFAQCCCNYFFEKYGEAYRYLASTFHFGPMERGEPNQHQYQILSGEARLTPVTAAILGGTSSISEVQRAATIVSEEPADSHVTSQDILRIGRALIGYRHVSSEALAQDNARNGIPDGCSLNISFCPPEGYGMQGMFTDLDLKIAAGENCDLVIEEYEKAITDFILRSMIYDHHEIANYEELLSSLDYTRFMVVKTGWDKARDVDYYEGLGRFPKETIAPDGVVLLRPIRREELGISEARLQQPISQEGYEAIAKRMASFYRRELLLYLRKDFNPSHFNALAK